MTTELTVKIHKQEEASVLELSGDLDAFTCGKLRDAIVELLDDGSRKIIISMSKIKYIDSSGLGTLVGGLRRINEQGGALALFGASAQVRKVFLITGLSKVFPLYETQDEAISALKN